jgi:hypothetical protein
LPNYQDHFKSFWLEKKKNRERSRQRREVGRGGGNLAIWQKANPPGTSAPPSLVSLGACLALLLPDWLASAGLSVPLRFCLTALSLSCFCQIAKLPSPFQKFSE